MLGGMALEAAADGVEGLEAGTLAAAGGRGREGKARREGLQHERRNARTPTLGRIIEV
jgi:hypothetical protein